MTNNNEPNVPVDEKSLSQETQDVINSVRDYIVRAKKSKSLFPFIDSNDWEELLKSLGFLRDSLRLPIENAADAYALSLYCFSMVRNFGISALYDRYVLFFIEKIQLKKDDKYHELQSYIFPRWEELNSERARATREAPTYYPEVKNKLIKLGFKKGFLNSDHAHKLLLENFSHIRPSTFQWSKLDELIGRKNVQLIAEIICASRYNMSPYTYQKDRQKSKRLRSK